MTVKHPPFFQCYTLNYLMSNSELTYFNLFDVICIMIWILHIYINVVFTVLNKCNILSVKKLGLFGYFFAILDLDKNGKNGWETKEKYPLLEVPIYMIGWLWSHLGVNHWRPKKIQVKYWWYSHRGIYFTWKE